MSHFERLSAQDASFLAYEDVDRHAHMHIGGVSIYDGGGLTNARGGVDIERIRRYIASRLHLVPRYRQRLAWTPVFREPVWVDDERFNVRYHVRHSRLPRPGDEAELKRLVGRIMSQRLDRTRPLWEMWVVEGLPDGRFGMVTKTHHCMIDGVSGVDISTVLMRLDDDASIEEPPPWTPRPAPSAGALLADALGRRAALAGRVAAQAPGLLRRAVGAGIRAASDPRGVTDGLGRAVETIGMTLRGPAATPFNQPIGAHRRYDWTRVALDDVRTIKRRLGGTVNDAVLAVVAGAIGAYLRSRRVATDILDFVAAIPVNARQADDHSPGTHVGAWLARLPIAERDPVLRLAAVRETTAALKQGGGDPTQSLYGLAEIGGGPTLDLVVQLMRRLSPANVIVTNVPGPPFPLFLVGARMEAACPMVTLMAGQGLGIAVFSYCGQLFFGVNADWDLVPDLDRLMAAIDEAVAELLAAAGGRGEAVPPAALSGPAGAPPGESHGG